MAEEEKKKEGGSFLSSLGRIQPPRPAPPPPPSAPGLKHLGPSAPPPPEGAASQARFAELERAVKALQAEVQSLKTAAAAPKQDPRTEKEIGEVNKKLELLGNTVRELDSTAIQERISASAVKIAVLEAGFSDMSKALLTLKRDMHEAVAEYGANFLALKNGLQALKTDSQYLESSLEKLKEKAAGLEKAFGPGMEELREKLASLEKAEKRAFLELETGLEKAFQEKFRDMLAQLRTVREKLNDLSEDYRLVVEKRMLLLESKYSAFETFSRRLDSLAPKKP